MRSCNDDMTIDVKGSHRLSLRLKIQLQPHGVDLNTDAFAQMLKEDNSIENIIRFSSDILYPQVALQKAQDKEEDLEDAFDNTGRSKSAPKAFEIAISEGSGDEGKDGTVKLKEKMGMFTVTDEKYSRGSTEVARGTRMCILPQRQRVLPSERITRTTNLINEACNYCRVATERAEV